jgi:hypothetical protein
MKKEQAKKSLAAALACQPDEWMKKSTRNNLMKVYNKMLVTGSHATEISWLLEIINRLAPLPEASVQNAAK